MGNFNDLLGEHAGEIPAELADKLTTDVVGGGGYYVHTVGDYKALFSGLRLHYKDAEQKKCDKDKPGAKLTGASARFLVIKDPELQLVDSKLAVDTTQDLGRLTYNHYLSLKEDDQWKHARALADFTINDMPEANIVQDNGKKLLLQNLQLFVGIGVTFKIIEGKKEGSRYASDFVLADHSVLTKEKIASRSKVVDAIEKQLTEYAERLEKERAEKKANSTSSPSEETVTYDEEDDGLTGLL